LQQVALLLEEILTMRHAGLLRAALASILTGCGSQSPPASNGAQLAIAGITIIDVASGRLVPEQTVVIRANRIVAVGADKATSLPSGTRIIMGAGGFLIPGLWDMHAHSMDDTLTRTNLMPLWVANGVTGVRIMWGWSWNLTERAEVAAGRLLGPRMVVATPIIDGRMWEGSLAPRSPEAARRMVDSLARLGYDFVKTLQFLPRDVYFAIADQAKRAGIPFAGHLPIGVSAAEASDVGQRSFEHGMDLTLSCSRDEARIRSDLMTKEAKLPPNSFGPHVEMMVRAEMAPLPSFDASACVNLAATLRRNDTWLVPTLGLYRGYGSAKSSPVASDPRLKFIPLDLRRFWNDSPPIPAFDSLRTSMASHAALMAHSGVGILAGTDMQNRYVLPGFGLHDELALLVNAGLTPLEALQAATLNPARFLRATDSLGTVEQGKVADLVILDANPLDDIRNTTKIRAVIANGRYIDRAPLDTLLAAAERAASPPSTK
jgi:imidazolonepropionase-like amidohydrolase